MIHLCPVCDDAYGYCRNCNLPREWRGTGSYRENRCRCHAPYRVKCPAHRQPWFECDVCGAVGLGRGGTHVSNYLHSERVKGLVACLDCSAAIMQAVSVGFDAVLEVRSGSRARDVLKYTLASEEGAP